MSSSSRPLNSQLSTEVTAGSVGNSMSSSHTYTTAVTTDISSQIPHRTTCFHPINSQYHNSLSQAPRVSHDVSMSEGTHKHSKSIPTESQIHEDFLKRELAAAQTRIVQLDSEIEDKNKRIDILWTRIKIYEEQENSVIYDKYFPSSNSYYNSHCSAGCPRSQCSSSFVGSCHHNSDRCRTRCSPCGNEHGNMRTDFHQRNYDRIIESISKLRIDLDAITATVVEIENRTTTDGASASNRFPHSSKTDHATNVLEVSTEEQRADMSATSEEILIQDDPMCSLYLN